MRLSPAQLRAARALLNWSRAELSTRAHVSAPTVHRFENEITLPEERTISKIHDVLARAGIAFVGDNGVLLQDNSVRTLYGEHVFVQVLEDVMNAIGNTKGAEALFACVCDQVSPPPVIDAYNKLRAGGVRMRSLVHEDDTYLMGNLNEYRCLPGAFFHNNTTVIYGDKVATMILDPTTGADVGAVLIQNPHVTTAQRNLFELIWTNSKRPKRSTATEKYQDVVKA